MFLKGPVLLLLSTYLSKVQSLSVGHFNTLDIHPSTEAYEINAAFIDLSCRPSDRFFGNNNGQTLTTFTMSRENGNVIGRAFSGGVKPDGSGSSSAFVTFIRGWGGSKIPYAESSWLNLNANDLNDFEMGWKWNLNVYGSGLVPEQNSKDYSFANYFAQPPKVAVFVNAISQFWGNNFRFNTYADNVSRYGFTLHMDTWGGTQMSGAGTTWIAYPADKKSVDSGHASSWDYRAWDKPTPSNGAYHAFTPGTFSTTPQIFIGIQSFDISQAHPFRLRVYADNISKDGFNWHCDGWDDTIVYGCGVSWLAFV